MNRYVSRGFFLLCEIPNNSITKYVITSLTWNNSIGTLHIFFSASKKVMVEIVHQIQKVRGRNESFSFKEKMGYGRLIVGKHLS